MNDFVEANSCNHSRVVSMVIAVLGRLKPATALHMSTLAQGEYVVSHAALCRNVVGRKSIGRFSRGKSLLRMG